MENESITYNFPFELSIIEYQVEIYEASWDMIRLMIICKKGSEILRCFITRKVHLSLQFLKDKDSQRSFQPNYWNFKQLNTKMTE